MNRHPGIAVALVGLGAALAACSGNSTTPSATDNTTASPTSPAPSATSDNCTKTHLADPAAAAARALGTDNIYTIDGLQCADGWAVTSGVLASTQNPNMGAPTSFVFRREGEVWVGQDKAKVCGTNPTTTTAPADAAIPAALFLSGCAAG
jgi:hypothetical protein